MFLEDNWGKPFILSNTRSFTSIRASQDDPFAVNPFFVTGVMAYLSYPESSTSEIGELIEP